MPRTVGVMPSGSTLRVKKTFLNKMLTDETAKNIGLSSYYPYVRKVFDDILRALDTQFGRPFLMTNTTSASKEAPDDAKPKLDLFRTVIAAIPRLIPDGMSRNELVDTLSRLTVHNDEELQALACQGLQNLVIGKKKIIFNSTKKIINYCFHSGPENLKESRQKKLVKSNKKIK